MRKSYKKRLVEREMEYDLLFTRWDAQCRLVRKLQAEIERYKKIADDLKNETIEWQRKYIEQVEKNIVLSDALEGGAKDEQRGAKGIQSHLL